MSLMHLGAISKASRSRDLTDHLLVFFGGALALYSIAASLRKEGLAIALVGSYFACSALGFLLARASVGTKWRNWDGGLTALFGFLGFVLSPRINAGLPEGGFPFELLTAAALSFMLIFSSLSGWRDRTLLFQSLPCIALFGLVGTFDTFPFGIWFFFGFLVSNGVLYARVHRRTMIRRAELAGESDPGLLTRGAWKWMAGPEWAFISGFVIVLLSLLGAPVIRSTVQPVTAQVRTNIPNALQQALRQNEDRQNRGITPGTAVENRIGRGPADQDETPRLRVRMSGPGYLRNERFAIYNSSGWNKAAISVSEDNPIGYRRSTAMGNTIPGPNGGVKGWAGGMPPTEELLDFQVERVQYRALSNLGATILAPGPV
ncbi:MAG: hypothetical protein MH204_00330, partial [Fimbriimonadaceae bacterium]|nr:hypothetical protein [Fimbriimonadaceae bacterium]